MKTFKRQREISLNLIVLRRQSPARRGFNSLQHLLSVFFITAILVNGECYPIVVFFFFLRFIYLFYWLIDWLLCWVFVSVLGLSLVAASGGHSSSRCLVLSLSWPLLLRSTGSRRASSVVVAHRPSCSAACGLFPDQGSNPCPLHWQADSQPLHHQGSPHCSFNFNTTNVVKHLLVYILSHIFVSTMSIQIFCPFFQLGFFVILLNCKSSLYILDPMPLSDI